VYTGTVARIAHALDPKTRTMPVDLDVLNRDGTLAPGMYNRAEWVAVKKGDEEEDLIEVSGSLAARELRVGMPVGVK
jgi:hypothetical protein